MQGTHVGRGRRRLSIWPAPLKGKRNLNKDGQIFG
jgi:hypothetical protein